MPSPPRLGIAVLWGWIVPTRTAGRAGRPWRRVQAKVYAEETHCCLCGRYVDQTLANYRQSQARSVHHLIPPDIAPDLALNRDNLRLAHLGCNARHGRGIYQGAFSQGGANMGAPLAGSHPGPTHMGGSEWRTPTPVVVTSRAW